MAHMEDQVAAPKLDDMWQRQQKKTFTAWMNSHLRKKGMKCEVPETDMCDGKMLLALLEVISEETLPKPARGNMKIHKVQNVNNAFTFIKEKGINLVSIGAEEIVDGNLKMILGMLWTLILRFEIQDISLEAMSAKDALLLWCQRKTAPYDNVNVQNFHMSFKDGLVFNALIHRHRPELIDYKSLSKENSRNNFETAFKTAEEELDIAQMLDIDDMVDCVKPDERSVMTQVVAYYKAFANSNKNENAARKIATVLETNREHERMIQEYEEMSSALLAWIAAKVAELGERSTLHGVEACQAKLEGNNTFRTVEYPPKLNEKGTLEAHYSTLQTKLRLSGRPGYVPSEGRLISDIAAAWDTVAAADVAQKDWIVDELHRNRLASNKAETFNNKATSHESWTSGKDSELSTDDYSSSNLAGVVALKKKHEAFEVDLAAHESRVADIGTLANELNELQYQHADGVNDRYATIYEDWQKVVSLSQERQANLDNAQAVQQRLDELCVQYAKEAPAFSNYLELTKEELTEAYIADTIADVEKMNGDLEALKAGLPPHEEEYASLTDLKAQIGANDNPYSPHKYDTLSAQWQEIQGLVSARAQQLAEESQKQNDREAIRKEFAAQANAAHTWMTDKATGLMSLVEECSFDSIEEQVDAVKEILVDVDAYKATMDVLEQVHQKTQESLIFHNEHTNVTIETLRGDYQTLSAKLTRQINELGNQILSRDSSNITDEQLKEYEDSFNHFDKDRSGFLDKVEFRACLLSLGFDMPQTLTEGQADPEFDRVMSFVDPNKDGRVSFDEFKAFMAQENADADNSEDLLAAFKVLAGDKEYVLASELQRDLGPELYEYCVANMTPYEGGPEGALDFASFAGALYGESDL